MSRLSVTLVGTGSPIPDPDRGGPCSLVRSETATVLVDAGRGAVMRLAGLGIATPMIDAVLLTHLHSDHICALNDIVTTAWVTSPIAKPQLIYGPPGTRSVVDGMLAMLAPDVGYRLAHHDDLETPPQIDVHELDPGSGFDVGGLSITVAATDHRPVEPTLGYRITDGSGVIVMAGDGVPCASLDELCRDADVYVQTVVRDDLIRPVGYQRFTDILDYHSTVAEAARTAARCGVARLVLTHMVPAVAPGTEDEWAGLAREHFDGDIIVGADGAVIEAA